MFAHKKKAHTFFFCVRICGQKWIVVGLDRWDLCLLVFIFIFTFFFWYALNADTNQPYSANGSSDYIFKFCFVFCFRSFESLRALSHLILSQCVQSVYKNILEEIKFHFGLICFIYSFLFLVFGWIFHSWKVGIIYYYSFCLK